jgi:hypothetical protein
MFLAFTDEFVGMVGGTHFKFNWVLPAVLAEFLMIFLRLSKLMLV